MKEWRYSRTEKHKSNNMPDICNTYVHPQIQCQFLETRIRHSILYTHLCAHMMIISRYFVRFFFSFFISFLDKLPLAFEAIKIFSC